MIQRLLCAVVVVVASACGGGSPTSPATDSCTPQTLQCLMGGAVLVIAVNGGNADAGSTQSVAAVSSFGLTFHYNNSSGQNLWVGFLFVRDDGLERLSNCFGLGGGIGAANINLAAQVSPNDPMFAPGHTVTATLVATFGPSPSGGVCPLRTSTGQLDHAAVQAQRALVTFVVQ